MSKFIDIDEKLIISSKVHNNKYDYSLVEYVNSRTKIKIICPIHGIFEQRLDHHISGHGCKSCASKTLSDVHKVDINDFITKSRNIHGNKYDYSLVEYVNSRTKIKIICPIHGIFEQLPSSHIMGHGCPKCSIINNSIKQRKSLSCFINESKQIHGNKYDYSLVEYVNNKTKVKIICSEHGMFEQSPSSHINGNGCPICANNIRLTTKEFINKSRQIHGNKYDYSLVDYINTNIKVNIICPEHGVFEQLPYNHLDGRGCGYCVNNITLTKDYFINESKQIHGNKYDYSLVEYVNSKTKIKIICPEHGVFEQLPYSHRNGNGCPVCVNSISRQELELQEWLSQYTNIITNDRTLISPLELDIIIPSHKIAIEYNGIYWHSEQQGKDDRYHLNKYNLCKDKGYRLIQVWENEWINKQDIVKSIILSALGIYERKIHGRKCVIKIVNTETSRQFYNDNHIQGFQGGEHHGLYHNDELVSLMTVKYYKKQPMLERFVNKQNTIIHGAFSKLLKSFDNIDNLVTFSDPRYFTGNVYERNGFELEYMSRPNYWYVINGSVYHRRSFQKKKIKDYYTKGLFVCYNNEKTEYQNMLSNGFDRIWDCGNMKYVYKKEI